MLLEKLGREGKGITGKEEFSGIIHSEPIDGMFEEQNQYDYFLKIRLYRITTNLSVCIREITNF